MACFVENVNNRTVASATRGVLRRFGWVFLVCMLGISALWADDACRVSPDVLEIHKVDFVYDGDTVRLSNGDRVRLIGIDTTERGYDRGPSEPFAEEATEALKSIIAAHGGKVGLVDGVESHDRFGRRLAYLHTPEGDSIEAELLRQGLAMAVYIAPNTDRAACFQAVEAEARARGLGIWSLDLFEPGIPTVNGIPDEVEGAGIVYGKVVSVGESQRNIWINLEGRVALRLDKHEGDLLEGRNPDDLVGQTLRARGWIIENRNQYQDWMISITSPYSIEYLDE